MRFARTVDRREKKEMTDMFGAFLLLGTAIVIEVLATALLPKAEGFTHAGWAAVVLAGYGVSIWLLTLVVKQMPVSVAYAVWAGAGTALVAVVGLLFLGEPWSWLKALCLAMIVGGVVGLNLASAH